MSRRVTAAMLAGLLACSTLSSCAEPPASKSDDGPPSRALASIAQLDLVPGETADTAKAVAATERYLDVFEAAIADPKSSDPNAFSSIATGPALSNLSDQIYLMRRENLVAWGKSERRLVLLGHRDADWYLMNCASNGQVVIHDADSGEKRENIDPGFAISVFGLREIDSSWKVHHVMVFSESRCPT